MRVIVCRPSELSSAEIERWRELQHHDVWLSHPFAAPEFAIAADRVREDVRVAVVEEGSCAVGFLGYRKGRDGVARCVAPGVTNIEGFAYEVQGRLELPQVLAGAGLLGWRYQHVPRFEGLGNAPLSFDDTWISDLRPGLPAFKEWLGRERKGHVKGWERKARALDRDHKCVEFHLDTRSPELMQELITLKRQQFAARGWRDCFDLSWVRALTEQLMTMQSDELRATVSALIVDGEIASAEFGLTSKQVHAVWFLAYSPTFASYSPGVQLNNRLTDCLGATGVQIIDHGVGATDLKRQLSNATVRVGNGFVGRAGLSGAVATRVGGGVIQLIGRAPKLDHGAHEMVQALRRKRQRLFGSSLSTR